MDRCGFEICFFETNNKTGEKILIFSWEKRRIFSYPPQFCSLSRHTECHSDCCKGKEATPTDVGLLERRSRRTGSLLPPMFSYTTRDTQKGSRKETPEDKRENNYDSLDRSISRICLETGCYVLLKQIMWQCINERTSSIYMYKAIHQIYEYFDKLVIDYFLNKNVNILIVNV